MAQIVTITNPLTGQPAQVDQLDHTAQQIDDGIGFESTEYPGCYYRMVDGVVEWFNPPMQVGGIDADGNPINEYRTTERYLGKPVYAKLVYFGALPNATTRYVNPGISNFDTLTEPMIVKITQSDGGINETPYVTDTAIRGRAWFKMASGGICIRTMEDCSSSTAYVKLKYTKTTD